MGESGNGNGDTGPGEFSDTDALGGFSDSNVDDSSSDSGTSFGVSLGPGQGSVSATGSTAQDQSIGFSDGKGGPGDNFSAFGGITDSAGNPVGKEAQSPSEVAAAMDAISVDQALNEFLILQLMLIKAVKLHHRPLNKLQWMYQDLMRLVPLLQVFHQ